MVLPREKFICVGLFLLCVCLNLALSSVGWDYNLREVHEFRQTQTALSARYIQREGWSLAAPLPLFGPPWSAPMEFPLYQLVVAKVSTWTGLPLESAGRFVSLLFLYLSLPAFFLLLRFLAIPPDRRFLFLALLLVTPVYLCYSRAFMIESAALCAAAWFLYAYCRALETRRVSWIIIGIALGSIAALTKVTTFAVFLFPALAFTLHRIWFAHRESQNSLRIPAVVAATALAVTVPSLTVGIAWISYADRIKNSNPLSRFLASENLHEWNYGSLAQRLDPNFWQTLWQHASGSVLQTIGIALTVALTVLLGTAARQRIGVLLLCFLAGPLVFSNLYLLHDYYFYATGVFLLAAAVIAWNALLDASAIPRALRWAVILVTMGMQVLGFTRTYFQVQTRGDLEQPELGRILGTITHPSDLLLVHGFAWNPAIAYASDRKAIMMTDESANDRAALDEVLSRIPPDSIGALVMAGDLRSDAAYIRRLTDRLQLEPDPILRSDETLVFLARRLVPNAVPRFERMHLTTLTLMTPPDAELNGVKLRRYRVSNLANPEAVSMFSPRPSQILAPFGVITAVLNNTRVLNAHAPTEITVPLERSSRTLTAIFGILPDAFTGEKKTDGILFRIDLISPNGTPTVLHESMLEPAVVPEHRNPQRIELPLPPNAEGDLVFRTLPGPHNDISFDWAYWTSVEIK